MELQSQGKNQEEGRKGVKSGSLKVGPISDPNSRLILWQKVKYNGMDMWVPIVEKKQSKKLLEEIHADYHPGINAMIDEIKKFAYWDGYSEDVKKLIHNCSHCIKHKGSKVKFKK
jgi:hypothetical protein